jgi:LmbE family N-acetylglucosaminyl deacetylase
MTVTTLVVSPHLDDGVLSCGHLLLTQPHSVVATVMAGHPGPGTLSDWDRACGFVEGDDPVARRREEDREALDLVGARPWHLDFLDLPYREARHPDPGGTISATDVAHHLMDLVHELAPTRVLIPLGLLHPDHVLTHEAGVLLRQSAPAVALWAYKDLPYGLARPDLVTSQLDGLLRRGVRVRQVSVEIPADAEVKRDATARYVSQVDQVMNDLGREAWERTFLEGGEQFWQLTEA